MARPRERRGGYLCQCVLGGRRSFYVRACTWGRGCVCAAGSAGPAPGRRLRFGDRDLSLARELGNWAGKGEGRKPGESDPF